MKQAGIWWILNTYFRFNNRYQEIFIRAIFLNKNGNPFTVVQPRETYSKTCLKRHLKIDKPKILMTNGSLMKVESIAKRTPWSNTFDLH